MLTAAYDRLELVEANYVFKVIFICWFLVMMTLVLSECLCPFSLDYLPEEALLDAGFFCFWLFLLLDLFLFVFAQELFKVAKSWAILFMLISLESTLTCT